MDPHGNNSSKWANGAPLGISKSYLSTRAPYRNEGLIGQMSPILEYEGHIGICWRGSFIVNRFAKVCPVVNFYNYVSVLFNY